MLGCHLIGCEYKGSNSLSIFLHLLIALHNINIQGMKISIMLNNVEEGLEQSESSQGFHKFFAEALA